MSADTALTQIVESIKLEQRSVVELACGLRGPVLLQEALVTAGVSSLDIQMAQSNRMTWTMEQLDTQVRHALSQYPENVGHLIVVDIQTASARAGDHLLRSLEEPGGPWVIWLLHPKRNTLPATLKGRCMFSTTIEVTEKLPSFYQNYSLSETQKQTLLNMLPQQASAEQCNAGLTIVKPTSLQGFSSEKARSLLSASILLCTGSTNDYRNLSVVQKTVVQTILAVASTNMAQEFARQTAFASTSSQFTELVQKSQYWENLPFQWSVNIPLEKSLTSATHACWTDGGT